jgi:carboxypeptidase Taq
MNNHLKKYHEIQEKTAAYEIALNTLYWDQLTIAPKKGQPYRNKMMGILSGELFDITTSPETIEVIENVANDDSVDEVTKIEAQQLLKELNRIRFIPKSEYVEYIQLLGDSEMTWEEAKQSNNWELFKPYLKKIVEAKKKMVSYRKSDLPVYEQLLDDFEPGLNIKAYDEFFKLVKEKLVPLIKKINNKQIQPSPILSLHVSEEKQRKVIELLKKALNYSDETGYVATSVHPFSSGFSAFDNRVTVAYHEDMFTSSIFSFIHEVGHATYNGQVDPAFEGRYIRTSMSYGMHESQSRMYENMLGRSKAFWEPLYPKLVEIVDELQPYSLEDFVEAINYVSNSLIRTEADEVTYPLHVLVRYEIEKALFNNELDVEDLPEVWNEKMQEYLQVTPTSFSDGVLQDVHWSGGSFGYFPTYALGSAYSAQWYNQMASSLNIDQALKNEKFDLINDYLKVKIHKYGGLYTAPELFEKVCQASFDPTYYVDYLVHKYTRLLNL